MHYSLGTMNPYPRAGGALIVAFLLLSGACTDSGDGLVDGSKEGPNIVVQAIPFTEAQKIVGFEVVLPEYVSPGLATPRSGELLEDPQEVRAAYVDDAALPDGILALVLVAQAHADSYDLPDIGEQTNVNGVRVRYQESPYGGRQNVLVAEWELGPRYFHATFLGNDGASRESVRSEAFRMIRSVIMKAAQ